MLSAVSVFGYIVLLYLVCSIVLYLIQTLRVLFNYVRPTNLVSKYGKWAVVTGCTDGIGLAYARELAKRRMNIVLISRTKEKLNAVAHRIETDFNVETKIIEVDFSVGRNIYPFIANQLKNLDIGILVNNVGVMLPYPMYFEEISEQLIWNHVLVNIGSATMMTSLILPGMKKKRRGAIINLSSVLGVAPAPFLSVYSATKAYINQLSKALRYELRNSGVILQTLCPGFVNTRMVGYSEFLKRGSTDFLVPTAEQYAKHAILTLGVSDYTAGYYLHEVKRRIASISPDWMWINLLGIIYSRFRAQYFKEQKMLKKNY